MRADILDLLRSKCSVFHPKYDASCAFFIDALYLVEEISEYS
jgi:hypothetical protein